MARATLKDPAKVRRFLGQLATNQQLQDQYVASINNPRKKAAFFEKLDADLHEQDRELFVNADQDTIDLALLLESKALLITWSPSA